MKSSSKRLKLVGVVNVTPDSFSDGGKFLSPSDALEQALALQAAGADMIEIGGDSSRPGSVCAGPQVEWERIAPVLRELVGNVSADISVDTHHAEVARRAIALGVTCINDISAGSEPEMLRIVARHPVNFIMMYSRCSRPHIFDPAPAGDIVHNIVRALTERRACAITAGVDPDRIILDPGMGAFIHEDPSVSWELVRRFAEFAFLDSPLMLGVSRKGFLRANDESGPADRDAISAMLAAKVAGALALDPCFNGPCYIRAHNIDLHTQILNARV